MARSDSIRSGIVLVPMVFFLLLVSSTDLFAASNVAAEIGKKSAWTGEAVPLFITLYSPGPFTGTASFDLPELAKTAFIKTGSPIVGSETIDGESLLTQRHEFLVYTQRSGEVVVPPIQVRFAGKESFVGDTVRVEGRTPELRFESKRPPGTESLGIVVAAKDMEVEQTWSSADETTLNAGDLVQRTITRSASETTAMMFVPVARGEIDGVRIYATDPIVEDTMDRGSSTAKRADTIKYLFERPGEFELPAIEFVWWDTENDELKTKSVSGLTITVVGDIAETNLAETQQEDSQPSVSLTAVLVGGLLVLFGLFVSRRILTRILARRNAPEAVAARSVESACRSNDARKAYAALLAWRNAVASGSHSWKSESLNSISLAALESGSVFLNDCNELSQRLFGSDADASRWSGSPLLRSFGHIRSELKKSASSEESGTRLPALNPTNQVVS